jgi:hypothetical protein
LLIDFARSEWPNCPTVYLETGMRLFLNIAALSFLLSTASASAHGNAMSKKECHRHTGEKTYHCH